MKLAGQCRGAAKCALWAASAAVVAEQPGRLAGRSNGQDRPVLQTGTAYL